MQIPPGPPIIIRQTGAASIKPPALTYRERPPRAPAMVQSEVVKVPGRVLDPPPRQVIIEKTPDWPPAPADVYVERWLGFGQQQRRVVHEPAAPLAAKLPAPSNVAIEWDARDNTRTVQRYNFLGVENAIPAEYERVHSREITETRSLPVYVNETNFKVPSGEVLASDRVRPLEYQLVGDVQALDLVQDKSQLNHILRAMA